VVCRARRGGVLRQKVSVSLLSVLLGVALPALAAAGDDVFTTWVKKLTRSKDASERAEAAESLGKQGRPEAAAPLGEALSDPAPEVRAAAASALWTLGEKARPAEPALWKALDDSDLGVVVHAAGALGSLDAEPARLAPARRRCLAAGDVPTRFLAARGLIGVDPPADLLPHVFDYLDVQAQRRADPSADYRARDAAESNQELAEKALGRLVGTQDRALVAPLVERVGRDRPAQAAILAAMGGLDPAPDGWDDLLAARMGSHETRTRSVAADLASKRTAPDQARRWVPAAVRLVADTDEGVRSQAVWALGRAGGLAAEAVPALLDRLAKEGDADRREKLAEVLGDIGDRTQPVAQQVKVDVAAQVRPALEKAIAADPDPDVRKQALKSLDRLAIEPEEIVAILARTAESSRADDLTWAALQALRNRGLEAAPALETIRALQRHKNPQTADYAATIARELAEAIARTPAGVAPPAAAVPPASVAQAAARAPAPDPDAEARGLAVLRARGQEVSEASYMGALLSGDAELISAYVDTGMPAGQRFAAQNNRVPLHLLFLTRAACDPEVRPTAASTLAVVDLLFARGADANAADDNGTTPLMLAGDKCDAVLIGKLLAAGAKVDARSRSGLTALEMGMWSGNDGLEALIKAGARLAPETAAAHRKAYQANPKAIALIEKATAH
jgi:HEAT repeat protein